MFKNFYSVTLAVSVLAFSIFPGAAQSDSSAAKLINLHNRVQEKTSDKPTWQMAHIDNNLNSGDSIRTGSASRAEILYKDGTITRLGSNSILRIHTEPTEKRSSLRLLVGKLWLKVTKGNGLLKIETPSAVATVLGTELLVTNDANDVSHVTTLDGLVEVSSKLGDKTLVKPGQWVEIVPGKKMELPTPFDWDALKKNERFMLDPTFLPKPDDFIDDNNWK